ncbi:PaaI family thioesterase [Streptacidiphilus monticola]|uniref:PaaI family thioesterase n=1 Tax=Streptacidiphilus monticola TaxID=2161674 RepID=A0ABW1G4C9_9ACTN
MDIALWGSVSGVERVEALRAELADDPPAPYGLLGLRLTRVEKGAVEFSFTPGPGVLNRADVVHGGFVATALDEACGITALTMSDPATPFLTMSLNIEYLRPLLAGRTYTVTGTVVHSGRVRTLTRAEISDEVGRLCATATSALTPNRKVLEALDRSAD